MGLFHRKGFEWVRIEYDRYEKSSGSNILGGAQCDNMVGDSGGAFFNSGGIS